MQPSQPQEKKEQEKEIEEQKEKKAGLGLSKERRVELEPLRRKLISMSYGGGGQGADPGVLFSMYDRDSSGQLDFREFSNAVRKGVSSATLHTA